MLNLLIALGLIAFIVYSAKKFYFPTETATHPESYIPKPEAKLSKKEAGIILAQLARWRDEGRISREEFDHISDICLEEMNPAPPQNS